MTVIAGICVDVIGAAVHVEAVATAPSDPLSFRTRRVVSSLPADDVADEQPKWIPLDRDHDGRAIGRVLHLERAHSGSVWAVASIDDPSVDLDGMSFSVAAHRDSTGRGWRPADPWTIDAVSLTRKPAMRCLGSVQVVDVSDLDAIDERWVLTTAVREAHLAGLMKRARDTARSRRRDAPILVHDVDERRAEQRAEQYAQLHLRHLPLHRSGHVGRVISVH